MNTTQPSSCLWILVSIVQRYYINRVICFGFNVLIILSSTILNATTALAYWKSSQLRTKTSYFIIMLMSSSDLGVGMICEPLYSIILMRAILGFESCSLTEAFLILTSAISGLSSSILLVLTIERYLGIVYPLFHRNKVNKSKALKAVVFLWFISATLCVVNFLDTKIGKLILGLSMSVNLTIIVSIYVKIFLIGRRTTLNNIPGSGITQEKVFLRKIKLAKSCLLVVGCHFVYFLPLSMMPFLPRSPFIEIGWMWSTTLTFANSTLNSILFFWRNKILRSEAKLILRQTFQRFHMKVCNS